MRRILSVLTAVLLGISLTACSEAAELSQESSESDTNVSSQAESASNMEQIFGSESAESNSGVRNILIVYFSRWGNTDYPDNADATASASIVVDEDIRYGTTEYIANMIAKEVGGDLHRIETVTPYTADFDELRDVNHDEMDQNYLPELKESNLDISGKTIIPFNSHNGSRFSSTIETIKELEPGATVIEDGFTVNQSGVPNAAGDVAAWVEKLGD